MGKNREKEYRVILIILLIKFINSNVLMLIVLTAYEYKDWIFPEVVVDTVWATSPDISKSFLFPDNPG